MSDNHHAASSDDISSVYREVLKSDADDVLVQFSRYRPTGYWMVVHEVWFMSDEDGDVLVDPKSDINPLGKENILNPESGTLADLIARTIDKGYDDFYVTRDVFEDHIVDEKHGIAAAFRTKAPRY